MSYYDDRIRDLREQLRDLEKQLRALQRLDVNPPISAVTVYSGTPTAGRIAYWTGAGTVAAAAFGTAHVPLVSGTPTAGQLAQWTSAGSVGQSGYAGSAVTRYSGVPTAGAIAYWTGNGTVAHAGFGTANLGLLGTANTWTQVNTFNVALATVLRLGTASATISSGAFTATASFMTIDTQAAAASDDLDTISGGTVGDIIIISTANAARDVVIKHLTGNIFCYTDKTLGSTNDLWVGIYAANGVWRQIAYLTSTNN